MSSTTKTADPVARFAACMSLILSTAALGVSGFAAYQSYRSANAAIANTRPVLDITVVDSVKVAEVLEIPIRIKNGGKSSASIDSVYLITFETEAVGGRSWWYQPMDDLTNGILRPGESIERVIAINRFQTINGVSVDVSKGADARRRLRFKLNYRGLELDEKFDSDVVIPVRWKD